MHRAAATYDTSDRLNGEGLRLQFGLVHVNFKTLERTPKSSACRYFDVIRQNGFPALPESPGK